VANALVPGDGTVSIWRLADEHLPQAGERPDDHQQLQRGCGRAVVMGRREGQIHRVAQAASAPAQKQTGRQK
jgi:hypothetical protein